MEMDERIHGWIGALELQKETKAEKKEKQKWQDLFASVLFKAKDDMEKESEAK